MSDTGGETFINSGNYTDRILVAQTAIHVIFLMSAMAIAIAYTDTLLPGAPPSAALAELPLCHP